MSESNRADRRARARAEGSRRQRLKKGLIAFGAVAALGAPVALGPAGLAHADTASPVAGVDLGSALGMLDDPLVGQFVEMCRTGGLATTPDSSKSTEVDPENPPLAVVDCEQSNGTGIALVLPDRIEVGQAAENMTMDLGDDINLLLIKYVMGERNLFEILGGVVLGSDTVKGAAALIGMPRVDPGAFNKYKTYEQIRKDAALEVKDAYKNGKCIRYGGFLGLSCQEYERIWYDGNLAKRTEALKMAEYLTGHKYDYTKRQDLPPFAKPIGSSTIAGDGINAALSMRGGTAAATTGNKLSAAIAGADNGRTSVANATLGFASAVNMNTDDIKITWFGQEIDFSKLLAAGLLDSSMAGAQGAEAKELLAMLGGINGSIPQLKEVSCFGVNTSATAEGLGSCTNILGTFDTYKDLRPITDGGHRQEQYGLTDVTSLIFGNDALLKQIAPLLGGDTDGLMDNPFVADLLKAMLLEEDRIKFAKDFIRYTKDVETTFAKEPVLDEDGNPELDDDGNPVMQVVKKPRMVGVTEMVDGEQKPVMIWVDADGNEVPEGTEGAKQVQKTEQAKDADGNPIFDPVIAKTTTAHWLTSDYGLRDPLVIKWLGHEIVFFPPVEINGTTRPNLIGLPQIRNIADDAEAGLLPKINLVQWDNPLGLGTLALHDLFDPLGIARNFVQSVTFVDDVRGAADLVGQLTGTPEEPSQDDTTDGVDDVTPAGLTSKPARTEAPESSATQEPVVTEEPVEEAPSTEENREQVDESPIEESPIDEVPVEEVPAAQTPAEGTVSDDSVQDAAPSAEPVGEPALS